MVTYLRGQNWYNFKFLLLSIAINAHETYIPINECIILILLILFGFATFQVCHRQFIKKPLTAAKRDKLVL